MPPAVSLAGSLPGYVGCLSVRQMAHTSTVVTPLSWSNRVSWLAVAPVVTTSSSRATCR